MIGKNELINWLREINIKLSKKIEIIAVGGTAMTLLGLKSSTIDIDFCLFSKDKAEFERFKRNGFKIDIFLDGYIFSEQLPDDYAKKSKIIIQMTNITLKALNPVDIAITKIARLNARDIEDIKILSRYINKEELSERFEIVVKTYAGKEDNYRENFTYIIKKVFYE